MDHKSRQLIVEYVSVSALTPDPRNPRRHTQIQISQIAFSIKRFGFNAPILVDEKNNVIVGHGRLLAAIKLGNDTVPVIRLACLSPAEARAYAIADNRLTENATWDEVLLGQVFTELAALDLDFSLEITGFSMGEIDLHIQNSTDLQTTDAAEALPLVSHNRVITKPGDIWAFDKHRIICGDATKPDTYDLLLKGTYASLIVGDFPYNLQIHGHVSGNGGQHHREFEMASGEMTRHEFTEFLSSVLKLLVDNSINGSIHFIFMDWRHLHELLDASVGKYSELKNICVWIKDRGGMGSLYRSQHELVLAFKKGRSPHRNNIQLGRYGRNRTNVWNYPNPNDFGRGEDRDLTSQHPTPKPVRLIADAIMDCSQRGDVVLDPFLGSGSTLIAAERVGRICYGIELDPAYVDLAVERWQRWTGDQAINEKTGLTFNATREGATNV
jgi:DNA modification methylase